MDASRQNSPSRKSRFRSSGTSPYRQSTSAGEAQPETAGESEVYAPGDLPADPPAADVEIVEVPPAEAPADASGFTASPVSESAAEVPAVEEDHLPAGLRLTRAVDLSSGRTHRPSTWLFVLTGLVGLALGGTGGYFLNAQRAGTAPAATGSETDNRAAVPILPLNPAALAEVDAAFEANKRGKFAEARLDFTGLAARHREWPSMQIEAARAALYEHNFDEADKKLNALVRAGPNADAEFLIGLLQMTLQVFDKSEAAFERAIAIDPARPDIFYFWGECLRREGKPQDAAEKFHQALIRNQYETTEGLYQLKLWLSEIQADRETASGTTAKIDADLVSGHPSGAALFATAARHIKAGRFKEAAEGIGQAQRTLDPAVFHVILQDPFFLQEAYRPELAPYYK